MLRLRSMIFDILMYGSMVIMGIVLSPAAIWSRAGAYWAVKLYCRWAIWLLRVICGLRVEVRGKVPEGEVLVCSKHQSFLDILILTKTLPRARFIMKKELKWAPILGAYAMRMGSTPVARGRKAAAMKEMTQGAEAQARTPGQTVIYPQGTRVLPGAYRPYKIGAGVLYRRLGQPCIPAATNVGVFWARRSPYRKPGLAVVEFLDPIEKGLNVEAFMEKIEKVIEGNSNRLMAEAGFHASPSV